MFDLSKACLHELTRRISSMLPLCYFGIDILDGFPRTIRRPKTLSWIKLTWLQPPHQVAGSTTRKYRKRIPLIQAF
jgi:hypothetical protein